MQRLTKINLAEDGDVIDAVIVCERLDESVAEARLAHADRALLLLAAGQADHRDRQHPGGAGPGRRVAAPKRQT